MRRKVRLPSARSDMEIVVRVLKAHREEAHEARFHVNMRGTGVWVGPVLRVHPTGDLKGLKARVIKGIRQRLGVAEDEQSDPNVKFVAADGSQ